MRRFCLDLNDLVGRETPEEPTFDTALDPLTAEIYLAAAEAGVKQHGIGWEGKALRVLTKLSREVPKFVQRRVEDVFEGGDEEAAEDPDVAISIEYAKQYFDEIPTGDEVIKDLACCLMDFAFVRQGIDDERVRHEKKEPAPEPKALLPVEAEELVPPEVAYELFAERVREVLTRWRPNTPYLMSEPIYRVTMVHAGLSDSHFDRLAAKCYWGARKYKAEHESDIATIGHAALALQTMEERQGIDPTEPGYELVKDFCRTCGGSLDRKRRRCCIYDEEKQALQREERLRERMKVMVKNTIKVMVAPPRNYPGKLDRWRVRETETSRGLVTEVRLDFWDEGIWQEVRDIQAAREFAERTLREHDKAQALLKVNEPISIFSNTELVIEKPDVKEVALARGDERGDLGVAQRAVALEVVELESQRNLGNSLRMLGALLGGIGFILTQHMAFIPMILVAWLMGYILIDKKAIESRREQLALSEKSSQS